MRICLASSFPEAQNRNLAIVADLAEGFREVLGDENVYVVRYLSVEAQVTRIRPSLLLLIGSALPGRANYREISRACREARSIFSFWTLEDPYEFDVSYKFSDYADIIFSNDAWACGFYERDRVYHLATASCARFRRSLSDYGSRSLDLFFCGVGFPNRQRLINDALPILEGCRSLIVGENWNPHPSGIISNQRLTREDLIGHYGVARCVLNLGRSFSYANSRWSLQSVTPGPRTFDAAMVGCVQLYHSPSRYLSSYFEIGTEIIGFETVEELEAVLDRLLSDPASACGIAEAAQQKALAEHTYARRARAILEVVGLMGKAES